MGLDLGALKDVQKDLTDRSEGGGLFFYQKEIGEETDIRILTPRANLNGKYFIEVIEWWIAGKRYTDPQTFGKRSVIQEIVDEALASSDKDLNKLAGDRDNCRKQSSFWIPILHLQLQNDNTFKVVDDKAKVASVGMMLMKSMNKVVTSRKAQVDSEFGITDREVGMNLILSKTGSGMKTEYAAVLGDQVEMPEKYYQDVPDVYEMAKKDLRPDDYLESVINNYLYGDEILPDPKKSDSPKDDKKASRPSRTSSRSEEDEDRPATTSRSSRASAKTETEDKPAKEDKPADAPPRRRSLSQLSDLD